MIEFDYRIKKIVALVRNNRRVLRKPAFESIGRMDVSLGSLRQSSKWRTPWPGLVIPYGARRDRSDASGHHRLVDVGGWLAADISARTCAGFRMRNRPPGKTAFVLRLAGAHEDPMGSTPKHRYSDACRPAAADVLEAARRLAIQNRGGCAGQRSG